MNGKNICKILKDIRKKIAEDNHITYVTSECKYQGECSGTCPKCEAELRYLEEELSVRKNLGKTVALAGVAAALVVGSAGCAAKIPDQTAGAPIATDYGYQTQPSTMEPSETELLLGEVAIEETTQPSEVELFGDIAYPTDELMGRIDQSEDPA